MRKVPISREDARSLADANRRAVRAQEAFDLAVARAKIPLLEALAAKNAEIERIADGYGIDPDRQFTFDAIGLTLAQDDPPPVLEPLPEPAQVGVGVGDMPNAFGSNRSQP